MVKNTDTTLGTQSGNATLTYVKYLRSFFTTDIIWQVTDFGVQRMLILRSVW